MCTPSTANTLRKESILINENALLFKNTLIQKSADLSPFPRYASGAEISIIGLLGGVINRQEEELVGRVLRQRKIFRNPDEAARANERATKIASHITLKKETLGDELRISNPRYLAAAFSYRQKSRFIQSVDWMLKSKVEVLITLEEWMNDLLATHPSAMYALPPPSLSVFTGVKIWLVEKRIDKPVKDSLNEQYLLSHFSEPHQYL